MDWHQFKTVSPNRTQFWQHLPFIEIEERFHAPRFRPEFTSGLHKLPIKVRKKADDIPSGPSISSFCIYLVTIDSSPHPYDS